MPGAFIGANKVVFVMLSTEVKPALFHIYLLILQHHITSRIRTTRSRQVIPAPKIHRNGKQMIFFAKMIEGDGDRVKCLAVETRQ